MNVVYYNVYMFILRKWGGYKDKTHFDNSCNFISGLTLFLLWTLMLLIWTIVNCLLKKKESSLPRLISHRTFRPPTLTRQPRGLLEQDQQEASSPGPSSGFVSVPSAIIRHQNLRTVDPVYPGEIYLEPRPLTDGRPIIAQKPALNIRRPSRTAPLVPESIYENAE